MSRFPGQFDYLQLRRLLTRRKEDRSINITRGLEAHFDNPTTACDGSSAVARFCETASEISRYQAHHKHERHTR